jgi:hypothetical protein
MRPPRYRPHRVHYRSPEPVLFRDRIGVATFTVPDTLPATSCKPLAIGGEFNAVAARLRRLNKR